MKKTDVQQRYDRGTYRPTINVKWMPFLHGLYRKFEGATATGPLICAVCGQAKFACEQGWEDAKELANDIFPQVVKVWSDSRSGGWLVVDGLPDVDDWDAIQLGYWAKFVKGVQAILDDLDYQFIWHLNVNVWEPHDEQAKLDAQRMVRS